MEDFKKHQIPVFGSWDFCDELPLTQYFETAGQASLIRGHSFGEDVNLSKVPEITKPDDTYHYHPHHHRKARGGRGVKQDEKLKQSKHGRVCDVTSRSRPRRRRVPKAVDEDLYKVPPEILYQKP